MTRENKLDKVLAKGSQPPQTTLGQGYFGTITQSPCGRYAIKTKNAGTKTASWLNELYRHGFIKRKSIDSPYLVKVIDVSFFLSIFDRSVRNAAITMTYCDKGNLTEFMSSHSLTENNVQQLFSQTALGLYHLQQHGVAHRDLKPDNIVLASNGKEVTAKIADYGLVKMVSIKDPRANSFCGTSLFMDPVIKTLHGKKEYNSFSTDIWSLALIFLVMMKNANIHHEQANTLLTLLGYSDDEKLTNHEKRALYNKQMDIVSYQTEYPHSMYNKGNQQEMTLTAKGAIEKLPAILPFTTIDPTTRVTLFHHTAKQLERHAKNNAPDILEQTGLLPNS